MDQERLEQLIAEELERERRENRDLEAEIRSALQLAEDASPRPQEEREEAEGEVAAQETIEEEEEAEEDNGLFDWVRAMIGAVLGVVLVFLFVIQLITVQGPSMQHTLYAGDKVLVLKSLFCNIEAGDIVMVHQYNAPLNETIIKRVVATGGQTVDIDYGSGTVYVDGTALEEDYIAERTYMDEGMTFPVTLGEGELFLMGDNRNHSTDSRSPMLGVVDERYVVGEAVFLLFPGKSAQYTGELPGSGPREFGRIGLIK